MMDQRFPIAEADYPVHLNAGVRMVGIPPAAAGEPARIIIETDEGPWGVYDAYCLKCSYRYISVAPVAAENVPLWECPNCGAMSVEYHLYEDDDDASTPG